MVKPNVIDASKLARFTYDARQHSHDSWYAFRCRVHLAHTATLRVLDDELRANLEFGEERHAYGFATRVVVKTAISEGRSAVINELHYERDGLL